VRVCEQADTPGADHGLAISIDVDEAELLNDVEMGGMSHGELVAHIRTVQQELLAKVRRGAAALHCCRWLCTCASGRFAAAACNRAGQLPAGATTHCAWSDADTRQSLTALRASALLLCLAAWVAVPQL
jgi:hypothetical protein